MEFPQVQSVTQSLYAPEQWELRIIRAWGMGTRAVWFALTDPCSHDTCTSSQSFMRFINNTNAAALKLRGLKSHDVGYAYPLSSQLSGYVHVTTSTAIPISQYTDNSQGLVTAFTNFVNQTVAYTLSQVHIADEGDDTVTARLTESTTTFLLTPDAIHSLQSMMPTARPPLELQQVGMFISVNDYFGNTNMRALLPTLTLQVNPALETILQQLTAIQTQLEQDSVNVTAVYTTATELIANVSAAQDRVNAPGNTTPDVNRGIAVTGATHTLAVLEQVKTADTTLQAHAAPTVGLQQEAHAIANRTGNPVDASAALTADRMAASILKQQTTSKNLVLASNTIQQRAQHILGQTPPPPSAPPPPVAASPPPVYTAVPEKPKPDRTIWTWLLIGALVLVILIVIVVLIVWAVHHHPGGMAKVHPTQ